MRLGSGEGGTRVGVSDGLRYVGYVAVRSWFYSEIRVRGCGARLRGEALPWGVRVDRE